MSGVNFAVENDERNKLKIEIENGKINKSKKDYQKGRGI